MSDNTKFLQSQKTTLSGSGCTSTATSITLSSLKLPDGSTNIAMTDLGDKGFATIEPGTSREEQITFTGITQNVDGSATLTGVVRGIRFVSPYDEVSGNKKSHAGGSIFIISNTAAFYDQLSGKDNDETVNGTWTFSTTPVISNAPVNATDAANKGYIDGIAIAGSPDASTSLKGISKLSVAPVSAVDPIAAGTNDTRIPTQDENDALVGTSGTAPSTSNKFIDAADATTTKTASKIARRDANGDILVSTTPTSGDAAASKTYVDSQKPSYVASNDNIIASSLSQVTYGSTIGKRKEIKLFNPGVVTVFFSLNQPNNDTNFGQVYINGSPVGVLRSVVTADGYKVFSENFTIAAGDLVQLYTYESVNYGSATVKDFKICGTSILNAPIVIL